MGWERNKNNDGRDTDFVGMLRKAYISNIGEPHTALIKAGVK